jgi:release factor glutamine methyltransferase
MTTIGAALKQGVVELQASGIEGARLDAQVLLGRVMDVPRATLYAYPEREIRPEQEQQYRQLIVRRKQHEPVAYLLGDQEFYGLDFLVDRRVLIPRPETELLVEAALANIRSRITGEHLPVVADIGTGSGAIPISILVEEPRLPFIYACDISQDALEVASLNSQRHHVTERIRLLHGDLTAPLPEPVDVLLANLPYIGSFEMETIPLDVSAYEPSLALFSGPDGLALLSRMCEEVYQSGTLSKGGMMLLEIGYQQAAPLINKLHALWPEAFVTCKKDYAGWDRLLLMRI